MKNITLKNINSVIKEVTQGGFFKGNAYFWLAVGMIVFASVINTHLILPFILTTVGLFIGLILAASEETEYRKILLTKKSMKNEFMVYSAFIIYMYWTIGQNLTPVPLSVTIFFMGLAVLIQSALIDFSIQELPDSCTLVFGIYLVMSLLLGGGFANILSRLTMSGVLMVIYVILYKISAGIGWGDIKLLLPITLLTTNVEIVLNYWLGAVIPALIYAIFYAIKHRDKLKETGFNFKFAFGPFLIIGLLLMFV